MAHLDPWPFVAAAYAVTLGGSALLALFSWRRMVRAERRAAQAGRER